MKRRFTYCATFTTLALLTMLGAWLAGSGCKDSEVAQFKAMGKRHRVTVYSGGVAVKTYTSTGNVSNQEQTDGWYFRDESTGKLVECAGTLTVEQID